MNTQLLVLRSLKLYLRGSRFAKPVSPGRRPWQSLDELK
jgi:hypothetical protein